MTKIVSSLGAAVLTAVALAGWVTFAPMARAEDAPPKLPTRDVDVLYRSIQPDAGGVVRVLEQRMRWAAAAGKLRIDPPTQGIHVIMDYHTRRLSTIRDATRQVLEIDAGAAAVGPGVGPQSTFRRQGESQVAGLTCTEWQTVDTVGAPTLACITADGVLLRAIGDGRVLVEATRVQYGPQDPVTFQVPAGYTRVEPPATQRQPPSGQIHP